MSGTRRVANICHLTPRKLNRWRESPQNNHDIRFKREVTFTGTQIQFPRGRSQFVEDWTVRKRIDFEILSCCEEIEDTNLTFVINTPNRTLLLNRGLSTSNGWHIIGKGGFGTVINAKYGGQSVAVKVVKLKSIHARRSMFREVNAMKLHHPHILPVLTVEIGPKYGIVVSEQLSKCNLQRIINKKLIHTHNERLRILEQICLGVQYCHENDIIHLDIKPANILLDCYGSCKIADFGNSIMINALGHLESSMGTPVYSAPEVLENKQLNITVKSDIYSIGIIMWQILTLCLPCSPNKGMCAWIYQVVKCGKRPADPIISKNISRFEKAFLLYYQRIYKSCWQQDSKQRPDIHELLTHIKCMQQKCTH